jgi:DNA repair protein RecO (recombination protein O)
VESHNSPAVVLRWRAYGESDKIVTFLTRDFGKITGIGKGARNSRRRFPNSLESLARVRVQFRQRDGASLAFLDSAELVGPETSAMSPERLAYGAYLTELAEQMTVEWNPVPEAYELLEEAMVSLEKGPATASFLRGFEIKLLDSAGFGPPLERCFQCGTGLDDDESYFAPSQGVFGCRRCASATDGWQSIDPALMRRLQSMRGWPLERCRTEPFPIGREQAARLTGQLLALHLVRPLKSLRMIEQLSKPRE